MGTIANQAQNNDKNHRSRIKTFFKALCFSHWMRRNWSKQLNLNGPFFRFAVLNEIQIANLLWIWNHGNSEKYIHNEHTNKRHTAFHSYPFTYWFYHSDDEMRNSIIFLYDLPFKTQWDSKFSEQFNHTHIQANLKVRLQHNSDIQTLVVAVDIVWKQIWCVLSAVCWPNILFHFKFTKNEKKKNKMNHYPSFEYCFWQSIYIMHLYIYVNSRLWTPPDSGPYT